MDWIAFAHSAFNTLVSWATTICLWLALILIAPWLAVLVYDILLYFWRSVTYEMPYIGGRARGRPPPQAPTLTDRPDGSPRTMPIPMPPALNDTVPIDGVLLSPESDQGVRRRNIQAEDSNE